MKFYLERYGMDEKVTIADAARELGMTPLSLRELMAQGRINIGYSYQRPGSGKRKFFVYRHLLDKEKERIFGT